MLLRNILLVRGLSRRMPAYYYRRKRYLEQHAKKTGSYKHEYVVGTFVHQKHTIHGQKAQINVCNFQLFSVRIND